LEVRIVDDFDVKLIKELTLLEKEAFGRGGLNEWTLPVFIKYGRVYILEEKGKVLGLAELVKDWNDQKLVFLVSFSICRNKRGQGLGDFFLERIIQLLKEEYVKVIRITVSSHNKVALKLYKKLGFTEIGYLKNEYGLGENRLLMELNLEEGVF